jgi:hypothetical protein
MTFLIISMIDDLLIKISDAINVPTNKVVVIKSSEILQSKSKFKLAIKWDIAFSLFPKKFC